MSPGRSDSPVVRRRLAALGEALANGLSVFTADYYLHIWYSTCRAFTSFALAVVLGVPLGILMGWRVRINEFASALLGLLKRWAASARTATPASVTSQAGVHRSCGRNLA